MTQYTDSYSSCPTQIQNIVANDLNILDSYVLMQTGQYEWTAQIEELGTGRTRQLKFTRPGTNYSSYYTVTRTEDIEFNMTIQNEYYVYSNVGYGNSLDLPVWKTTTSFSLMIISCSLLFAIVFKGALFKCLKRR